MSNIYGRRDKYECLLHFRGFLLPIREPHPSLSPANSDVFSTLWKLTFREEEILFNDAGVRQWLLSGSVEWRSLVLDQSGYCPFCRVTNYGKSHYRTRIRLRFEILWYTMIGRIRKGALIVQVYPAGLALLRCILILCYRKASIYSSIKDATKSSRQPQLCCTRLAHRWPCNTFPVALSNISFLRALLHTPVFQVSDIVGRKMKISPRF